LHTYKKQERVVAFVLSVVVLNVVFGWALLWQATKAKAVTLSISDQINAASPGSVITLPAQTFNEDIWISNSGTANAPITLRGAGIDATVIQGRIVITNSAAHLIIEDLSLNATSSGEDGIRITGNNQDITLRRLHIYGGTTSGHYGVRVGDASRDVLIEDSHIHNFQGSGTDSHGIGIMAAQRVTVRGCTIHDNHGDGVQSNTQDSGTQSPRASEILIENNDLYNNSENGIDIKSTLGLRAIGNRIHTFRPSSTSDGTAIQVQYGARDVEIAGNEVWDAVQGLEVTRGRKNGSDYPEAPERINIHHNYFHNTVLDSAASTGSGNGITVRAGSSIKIDNNTFANIAGTGVYLGKASGEKAAYVDVRNNVLQGTNNDADFSDPASSILGLLFDHNHYVTAKVDGKTLPIWLGQLFEQHASNGDPMLDASGKPVPNSPLIDSGEDIGLPFSGAAPDRGWAEMAGKAMPTATPLPTITPGPSPTPLNLPNKVYLPAALR